MYLVIVLLTQAGNKAAIILCYTSCILFMYTAVTLAYLDSELLACPSLEGALSTSESLESLAGWREEETGSMARRERQELGALVSSTVFSFAAIANVRLCNKT